MDIPTRDHPNVTTEAKGASRVVAAIKAAQPRPRNQHEPYVAKVSDDAL